MFTQGRANRSFSENVAGLQGSTRPRTGASISCSRSSVSPPSSRGSIAADSGGMPLPAKRCRSAVSCGGARRPDGDSGNDPVLHGWKGRPDHRFEPRYRPGDRGGVRRCRGEGGRLQPQAGRLRPRCAGDSLPRCRGGRDRVQRLRPQCDRQAGGRSRRAARPHRRPRRERGSQPLFRTAARYPGTRPGTRSWTRTCAATSGCATG